MDWTTIIASCVPAIISALVSYLIARHQGKSDLKKAAQENRAAIDRLMKQHEIDIESLREKHKMEMVTSLSPRAGICKLAHITFVLWLVFPLFKRL